MKKDERLARFSVGLYPLFLPRYTGLFKQLPADWAPYCGVRSMIDQARAFASGRTAPGKIVTNARASESPHEYGCAVDLTIFDAQGNPQWDHNRWNELEIAAKKCGLRWGGDFTSLPDRPHCELPLLVSWKEIGAVCRSQGLSAALQAINNNIVR